MLSESSANASFEIRGLSIVRFSDDGVQVGADNTVIAQNFIGLFPDGSAGTIGDVGIEVINGAAGAVIGGSASDGNVIGSTRDDGVRVDDGTSTVVDLDAALGTGNNTELIKELLPLAPCRVGGGIRSVEAAIEWLDAGATKVVLGTAACEATTGARSCGPTRGLRKACVTMWLGTKTRSLGNQSKS